MTGSIDRLQSPQALARERALDERHQDLELRLHELEQRIRDRDELLATIAHDLRTPLNTIIGWTQLLRSGGSRDPRLLAEGLEVVERSARLQTRRVAEFADASRLASGRTRLALAPTGLRAIIDAALDALGPPVRLEASFEGSDVRLEADSERLARAIALLVARAAEPADGAPVLLDAKRARDALEVRIYSRSKEPVSAFLLEGIEAFFVRSVIELHGGELRAGGTDAPPSFVVRLPLAETCASP